MSFHNSRRVGRHQPARPSGRHLWTVRGLLATSVVLVGWAGVSIVETQKVEQVSAPTAEITPVQQEGDPLRPERMLRKQRLLIEPPLQRSARPFKTAGVAVQRPEASPEPVAIRIPNLGIDQDLTELAVIGDDLQVPDDYSDVGWWRGGPVPGQEGAAVVVGHVDSPTGPAVFYQLSGLAPGDLIEVERDDGLRTIFKVAEIQVYDRTEFPSRRVYRPAGKPALHLLTCGGTFDAEVGQYSSNVVVYAPLVRRIKPEDGKAAKDRDRPAAKSSDAKPEDKKRDQDQDQDKKQDQDRQTAPVQEAASLPETEDMRLLRQLQDLFGSPEEDGLVRDVRKLFDVKRGERS